MTRPLSPWRAVTDAFQGEGSSNGLNRSQNRTARWWELTLECGHFVEKDVRYKPIAESTATSWGYRRGRSSEDVLPHPKRARCDQCRIEEARANT